MRSDIPWKILDSEIKYQNPWMRIREDRVITPTGSNGIYGVMETNDSVIVVAVNEKDEFLLIRCFSYPAQSWNWELPGGGGDNEDIVVASKRELLEETGITAQKWTKLGKTRVCNGLMTEQMTIYLAEDLVQTNNNEIADEQIDVIDFFDLGTIERMIRSGEINDSQSITALHFAKLHFQSK
jgi:8-oxo-dGTP pyrophosphatase MutT (NUDIX family)